MKSESSYPVMSIRVVLNPVKQKILSVWSALPPYVRKSIMILALFTTPIAAYWAIKECELRKNLNP